MKLEHNHLLQLYTIEKPRLIRAKALSEINVHAGPLVWCQPCAKLLDGTNQQM